MGHINVSHFLTRAFSFFSLFPPLSFSLSFPLFLSLSFLMHSLPLVLMPTLQNYFSDPWNVFDFVIVLGSFIDIIYSEMNVSGNCFPNSTFSLRTFNTNSKDSH